MGRYNHIRPEKIIDKATFTAPHQYPEGIEYIIMVNGVVIEKENTQKKSREKF